MAHQEITRKILEEIDRDPAISQKRLAEEVGISVGMINWHVKRCVTKGLIKLQQAPVRRYLYYLTPDGFSEKTRLTASYLQAGFEIFRKGRENYDDLFRRCQSEGWSRIALVGDTELTELALMVAGRYSRPTVVAVIDHYTSHEQRDGLPPVIGVDDLRRAAPDIDAAVVCQYLSSEELIGDDQVTTELGLDPSRFLVPGFLR